MVKFELVRKLWTVVWLFWVNEEAIFGKHLEVYIYNHLRMVTKITGQARSSGS